MAFGGPLAHVPPHFADHRGCGHHIFRQSVSGPPRSSETYLLASGFGVHSLASFFAGFSASLPANPHLHSGPGAVSGTHAAVSRRPLSASGRIRSLPVPVSVRTADLPASSPPDCARS